MRWLSLSVVYHCLAACSLASLPASSAANPIAEEGDLQHIPGDQCGQDGNRNCLGRRSPVGRIVTKPNTPVPMTVTLVTV